MRTILVLIGVLWASVASAQTHPCDVPVATPMTVAANTPLHAEFCQSPAANIDAVTIYRSGTAVNLTGMTQITPTPNSAGLVMYRVLVGAFPAGTYTIEMSNWNTSVVTGVAQEGPRSLPFTLVVVVPNPAPNAPIIKRVTP